MEWDPTERDAWVADGERWICSIPGVLQCKIDLNDSGEVTGVHVVAGMARDPRHIVRDVEGLLKARLDIDVYYKKIGVVQVLDNAGGTDAEAEPAAGAEEVAAAPAPDTPAGPAAPAGELPEPIPAILVAEDPAPRVVCSGVGVMATETTCRAEVRLRLAAVEVEGIREGPNHADSDIRLLAEATLAAVAEFITDPVLLHLREARVREVGGQSVVLTAVDLVEGRRSETLFGACGTSHNRQQAVVHAVLDALNRRLTLHGLKTRAERA